MPAAATTFGVTVGEKKGLKFTALTQGTEFNKGDSYEFRVESDNSNPDAVVQVYSNATRLTADAEGVYHATINGNTLIHVEYKMPQPTTTDKSWKLSAVEGGVGLATEVVNVPVGKTFVVRANAVKVPAGDEAVKHYAIVLTDKDGGIKEFISSVVTNYSGAQTNLMYNFNCQVKEAQVVEGNMIRLATSYNKKDWQLVEGESPAITDRLAAVGNKVIYHNVTMPTSVTGARIEGGAQQVVRGMPFSVKVSAVNPAQRVTVGINGEYKANKVAVANVSVPAVTSDLDVVIMVTDADEGDYMTYNIQEGQLASKLEDCPARVKLTGSMLVSDFDAIREHASTIVDLDMADVTVKGAAMTGNSIPENAFAPKSANQLSALRTVILPNNLERISNNAMARCTQISEITIPAGVNYIGDGAFAGCAALKKITAKPKVAPSCGKTSPFPAGASGISLVVPKGSEESYSVPSTWWTMLSLYKAPANAKDIYYVKADQSRVGVYNYKGNLNNFEVGQSGADLMLLLPNNQSPSQFKVNNNNYLRPGVAFKLFDNGVDIMENAIDYMWERANPEQTWSMVGGRYYLRWVPTEETGLWVPQNHEINVVFYYSLNFENGDGSGDVKSEIMEMPEGCEWRDVAMCKFLYSVNGKVNTEVKPVLYREGSEMKFQLTDVDPKTEYIVAMTSKVMTKAGATPTYEERETTLTADNGIYTIPALEGDTRIKITGIAHYDEGDPIPADDLATLKKEDVEAFTEVIVTGEMNATDFETLRDKFEAVETIDLSQIANEVIPEKAFAGMENLKSVTIPPTVTEIGEGAFHGCENIETLTLPGVNAIGEGAFDGCSNLTSILIPASDKLTEPTPAEAPAKRIRRAGVSRAGSAITAESFRGLNPNCLIYMGSKDIPNAESLNIILNEGGTRVAASDIILNGDHSFNAPASFNLGKHRISFTTEIPGSIGSDENDGWKGLMLPFTPSAIEYGAEFAKREGSGLTVVTFADENAEAMTQQKQIAANRPYMANVGAPYEKVAVTFYADAAEHEDGGFDVPYSPVPEETVAAGKNYSLYGSYNGETVIGNCYTLNDAKDKFVAAGDGEKLPVRSFDAYLCANDGDGDGEHTIGDHYLWIFDPASTGAEGMTLYRKNKIQIESATPQATVYYTTDGTDPLISETRKAYSEPFEMEGEEMNIRAIAEYKGNKSDETMLNFTLRKVDTDYALSKNWNWISHNMESPVAVADFAKEGIARILSQNEETVNYPQYGFVGELQELEPGVAYKVQIEMTDGRGM